MDIWLLIGALNGFLAVAAGAFGAHILESRLNAHDFSVFQTAAHYHLVHSLAVVGSALVATVSRSKAARIAAFLFTAGIVLFSGSLYFTVLAHSNALVLLTPAGGLLLLAGWASLCLAAFA